MDPSFQSSVEFPDPSGPWQEGLVALGGVPDVGTLYQAYRRGIFPWPQEGLPMLWFCPDRRGVLYFKDLHISRRLRTFLRKAPWRMTRNQAFDRVIRACSEQQRPEQAGTWILPEMILAYSNFHRAGFAQSFEVWDGQELIGGLYGVEVEGVFSGESMFHVRPNASKGALIFAIETLLSEGHHWMDTQMVTPVVADFGGTLIEKAQYLEMVKQRQEEKRRG